MWPLMGLPATAPNTGKRRRAGFQAQRLASVPLLCAARKSPGVRLPRPVLEEVNEC